MTKQTFYAFLIGAGAMTLVLVMLKAAGAEEAKPLTYGDVINISNAISSLDPRPGKDGKLEPSPYKFAPSTRMAFARIVDLGNGVATAFNKGILALDAKVGVNPGDNVPPDKMAEFQAERQKMLDEPAYVTLPRVKIADLCLEARPPECPIANELPFSTLALLKPIIADWDSK